MRLVSIAVLITLGSGCSFYFGDDGDDCQYGYDGTGAVPVDSGYRNPDNGVCEYYGGTNPCGDPLPYADGAHDALEAAPDWASCSSGCEGLDELTCTQATQCRAVYTNDAITDGPPSYLGCWGVAPSGPVTGEACDGLDGYGCSRHNDCAAVYNVDSAGNLSFGACTAELPEGCYSDTDCPAGYECTSDTMCLPPPDGGDVPVCYGQCVPSTNSCDAVDCGMGYHCEELCYPCDSPTGEDCDPYCEPQCVPDYNTCDAVDCGAGYHCEELCYPCDPLPDGTGCEDAPYCEPQCVPDVIPTCDGVDCGPDAHCELQCYPPDPTDPPGMDECYPVCVPNTSGSCDDITCADGYHCEYDCTAECTPDGDCPPPACTAECVPDTTGDACESLGTETECLARPDCVPVYDGDNCTCYPWGCECEVLTYDRCETGYVIDPPSGGMTRVPHILARSFSH